MSDTTKVKGLCTLFGTVFGYLYNCLTEMVVVLIVLMVMDYVLGMLEVHFQNKQFDKKKAIDGFIKKVLYGFVLVLGFLADYILGYLTKAVGVEMPFRSVFGLAAIIYLSGTEGFSCVGHCIAIGLPVPDFISKFFGFIRDEAGKIIKPDGKVAHQ